MLPKLLSVFFFLPGVVAFSPCSQSQTRFHPLLAKSTCSGSDEQDQAIVSDRRAFMSASGVLSASLLGLIGSPVLAHARSSKLDYKSVADDIAAIIKADADKGPTLVRLAWHSSGTYDKMTKTGGSGQGTIRFKEELAHGGNAGLGETAVVWMEDVKAKYGDSLSYADLYTLGGVVAIKELKGPIIPWRSGRVDALDPSAVTPDGRLPNAETGSLGADSSDAAHLRTIFNRMGFNDQEIVALSGAHALGRCHTSASGFDGPWTPLPTTFNNLYFQLLNSLTWTKRDWSGPFQYEDGGKKLMMLPTDLVLIQDAEFKKFVDIYASDQAKFFTDFTAAFTKLEELGTKNLVATNWA